MEESSDVPMETDVSSTTEDVPETQEVTGSHGNVEMVIVVEKVEEDMNSCSQTERETSKENTNDASDPVKKSPQIDIQVPTTAVKSPCKVESSKSPVKPESSQKETCKNSLHNEPQSSTETHQTGIPDSSSKDSQLSDDEIEKSTLNVVTNLVQNSPVKGAQLKELTKLVQRPSIKKNEIDDASKLKPIQLSPVKIQVPETTQSNQTQNSPIKIQAPETSQGKSVQSSPVRKQEMEANKSKLPNSSVKVQSTELTKTKQMQSSPVKIILTNNKPIQCSPVKNVQSIITCNKERAIQISPLKVKPSVDSPTKIKPIIVSPMKSFHPLDSASLKSNQLKPICNVQSLNSTQSKPNHNSKTMQTLDSNMGANGQSAIKSQPPESTTGKVHITAMKNVQAEESNKVISVQKLAPESIEVKSIQETSSNNALGSNGPIKDTVLPDNSVNNGEISSIEPKNHEDTSNTNKTSNMDIDTTVEKEASNDSQMDGNNATEKEHNKSISRELKSLIKSAKESKIISECTQLTTKMRKSRGALDSSNTCLNTSVEADRIQGNRRNSNNSQKSNCSEKSEKITLKRSMRSQNPDFVNKVKQFLNSVTGKAQKDTDEEDSEDEETTSKEKRKKEDSSAPNIKKTEPPLIDMNIDKGKLRSDPYCWRCHWTVEQAPHEKIAPMSCTVCPRSFHYKCLSGVERSKITSEKNWVCPECLLILQAESSDGRSLAMKKISLGMLCDLLKHALDRMMDLNGALFLYTTEIANELAAHGHLQNIRSRPKICFDYTVDVSLFQRTKVLCLMCLHLVDIPCHLTGIQQCEHCYLEVEPFMQPVDRAVFPDYEKYVVHPMDLSQMKSNIAGGLYGSTEAFVADTNWILHNSIIFNTLQSKLTGAARALVRSCRAETGEIEACPECYAAANARRPTWFTDVCTTPHILLWAKLKGFPYWPAKGMSVSGTGHVDVRFFGAHDRAWVPAKDCFLYSEKDPNNFRTKRQDILDSMQEAEQHIRNISRKYGKFVYPPFKTQLDPSKLGEQLKIMIPSFDGEVRTPVKDKSTASSPATKDKRSSTSKSSKSSLHDGDTSESEESSVVKSRKMADGAEIARVEEPTNEKEATIDDTRQSKGKESCRKRRRSELEEAVITIIEPSSTSSTEKRKRLEDDKADDKKSEQQKLTSTKETEKNDNVTQKTKDVEMTDVSEKKPDESSKAKDSEPSSSTAEKENRKNTPRVTPIRITLVSKDKKTSKTNLPKDSATKIITPSKVKTDSPSHTPTAKTATTNKDNSKTPTPSKDSAKTPTINKDSAKVHAANKDNKVTPQRQRSTKTDKNSTDDKSKSIKQRNSRKNKSLNGSAQKTDKSEKKKNEVNKDKAKENIAASKTNGNSTGKTGSEKLSLVDLMNANNTRPVRERLRFDEDTTLAVLARNSGKSVASPLPTISNVISLSTTALNKVAVTNTTTNSKTIEITVEANSDSSIFTPTSTSNVKTMNDAVNKLQKLRNDTEPVVGRVGVRAFARMTSPDRDQNKTQDNVEIEIKAEPIDLDDADRQMEKLDLMNSFRLRPVNPSAATLRDVRINKVVVTPFTARNPGKAVEVRPRAKKTFPQPKKDDGRSELNSKNSMVYIPIQPPATQSPLRAVRASGPPTIRLTAPIITTAGNSLLNPVSSPPMQVSTIATTSPASSNQTSSVAQAPSVPLVGQVPASVHTVPVMTSVNGQWMFSFQPVMSVGAIDNSAPTPILNGLPERAVPPLLTLPTVTSSVVATTTTSVVQAVPPTIQTSVLQAMCKTTDALPPGEPPRLQQRPQVLLLNPLDPNASVSHFPTPSSAGPLTAKLNQNAVKLTDFFRAMLEESLEKIAEPASQVATLTLRLEHETWKHQQAIQEMRHNHELTMAEIHASFEKENSRVVSELQRKHEAELEEAVKQAKSKQWCANCNQEAQFYCCWNTSYCDYPCQRAHWSQHFSVCTQQRGYQDGNHGNGEPPSSPEHRLQPQPDNLPKSASGPAPALTPAGKPPARINPLETSHQTNAQKPASIIVSMVQDQMGGQTIKCVGTYKPPSTQAAPIILNKQLLNSDEGNKKMVSSGGYLIVGAGGNSSSVVTPARRAHTIQYYS